MKCPKCSFVSHDYLDACRKCSIDLVDFKAQMHLIAIRPGVIDLSMVFEANSRTVAQAPYASRMQDDFLGSQMLVESEESDDTFDISLDDDFGMSPTQIEELRAIRPGEDDLNAEMPHAAMSHANFQESLNPLDPQDGDRISFDDTPPATSTPSGPPKSGYATVMIDLDDMEEMLDQSRDRAAEPGAAAAGGAPETPDAPDMELSSPDAEEFTLTTAEAEEPAVMEALEATADLSVVDDVTFEAEADDVTFEAEADDVTFEAEAGETIEALEATPEVAEIDEMTFEAEEVATAEVLEASSNPDEDEMTIIDEMVGFTSAEATESTRDLPDFEAEDSLELADLTDVSLEAQDVEEMDTHQMTDLESALEMPSIDLEAFTAEEPMEMALDDDPGEEAGPRQAPFAGMERDEAEDDLRLEFDDLDPEDDTRPSS